MDTKFQILGTRPVRSRRLRSGDGSFGVIIKNNVQMAESAENSNL